ncbi:hypothetical protein LOC71_20870 [Rhodopirellula sp. JC740]|uniref:Uncharacterized protein n=1 Tax=Rhodopirellula halodulae TaxID=2894198 RepID=A0ABS8NMC4_9BACT|nr:hypothetical protein [Rhodopirellula sp. JC740]MCC9644734.1 hypothetical protein [Rhodopirellula sp. JC740]
MVSADTHRAAGAATRANKLSSENMAEEGYRRRIWWRLQEAAERLVVGMVENQFEGGMVGRTQSEERSALRSSFLVCVGLLNDHSPNDQRSEAAFGLNVVALILRQFIQSQRRIFAVKSGEEGAIFANPA